MIKADLYEQINNVVSIVLSVAIFLFFMCRKEDNWSLTRIAYEKTESLRLKNKFLRVLFSKWTFIAITSAAYIGLYNAIYVFGDLSPFLANDTYFTYSNYFSMLFFGPVAVIGIQIIAGMDFRHGTDLLTPFFALDMGLGKIACFTAGCCYGIEWTNGMYNYQTGRIEFPVQLLESFIGIMIAAVLFFYLTKRKTKGKAYPLYMILYGATRFATEFLRGDHIANWLGMKPYQVLCLFSILLGSVWIAVIGILEKHNKRFLYDANLVDYILSKKKN